MNATRPWYRTNLTAESALSVHGLNLIQEFVAQTKKDQQPAGLLQSRPFNSTNIFDQSWIEYLGKREIDITEATVFYRAAHYIHPTAHIDSDKNKKPICALNWVITPNDDSEMVWYSNEGISPTEKIMMEHIPYVDCLGQPLFEVSRLCIGQQLTLVQVDVPHNVIVNNLDRIAITVRFKNNFVVWQDAVDFMKEYLI